MKDAATCVIGALMLAQLTLGAAQLTGSAKGAEAEVREAIERDDYDSAIRIADQALQGGVSSVALVYARGLAHARKNETDEAIRDYTAAIRLQPRFVDALIDRGAAYLRKEEPTKAIADFNEAIRIDPKSARAYCDRGDAATDLLHNNEQALKDYSKAIQLSPRFARAYCNRARILQMKRDFQRAIADYTQAISLTPADLAARAMRATAYHKAGDMPRAVDDARAAVRLKLKSAATPAERFVDLLLRARCFEILGLWDKALADYREAARLNPQAADAQNGVAWQLATCPDDHIRNGREAIIAAKNACNASHWEDSYVDTLAAAHAEAGDFDLAIKYEIEAIEKTSDAAFKAKFRQHLKLYQQHQPYRENSNSAPAAAAR